MEESVIDFRETPSWQLAMDLVHAVYRRTEGWPLDDGASLAGQIRSLSIAIPAKIANGVGTGNSKLLLQHLSAAHGSLGELRTLLYVAHDMDELDAAGLDDLTARVAAVRRSVDQLADAAPAAMPEANGHGNVRTSGIED